MLKSRLSYCIITIGVIVASWLLQSCSSEKDTGNVSFSEIEKNFRNIPAEVQTSVYWYWISDNLSKEGVIKDLEAMKKVGINRAFIGNIGLDQGNPPYGKVKILSDEWWDILHTALKTATKLNIEIGIFNGPGWSQSGGPWIKPEQSMRYLALSELSVKGSTSLDIVLKKPGEEFQDVKVLAFPYDAALSPIYSPEIHVSSVPKMGDIQNIADGNAETAITLQAGSTTVDIEYPTPYTVRSISVLPTHHPIVGNVELLVKKENSNDYQSIRKFDVNRTNPSLNVGFNPYGTIAITIPATTGKSFRVVISDANQNSGIAELTLSGEAIVERYVEKSLAKMYQSPLPYWHEYMWSSQSDATDPTAAINIEKVVDITQYMDKDGRLKWNVPEGNWKIIRSGMIPTGVTNQPASAEGVGLEVDKMSKAHAASHFDAFMGEIIRRIPAADRKTWKVVVQDSYETGAQNWTDTFIADFENRYKYNPVPFIPSLNGHVIGSRDITDRFLWDLRRFVADKVAYDYVGGLRDVSHKHGLTTWLENYGHWGFPGEFLQYGGQSDEIGGEFWSEGDLGNIENKAASSCGHIYGKRKISAESFTAGGGVYGRYPEQLKQRGDRFFTEGINSSLLHVYIHQPYEDKDPGVNTWFGCEFNRKNTWFYDMDIFIQYLKRCNYMLQQGTYVADAAYFIGEDAPKMTGVCDPALPKGYSFDYINGEILLNSTTVKDGYITLASGMRYKVLVLPKQNTMRPEILQKVAQLVNDGAIVLGSAPTQSPSYENYPKADETLKQTATALWGDVDGIKIKHATRGKGMIISGMEMQELFNLLNIIPDFDVKEDVPALFIHRTQKDGDLYFVSNQSGQVIEFDATFRITNKEPELWDPLTGNVRKLKAYTLAENKTSIPLKLEASESAFIIFRNKAGESLQGGVKVNYPDPEPILTIDSAWTVSFDAKMRGPQHPIKMDVLQDWTESANDSIKYYAGTAIYKNSINMSHISKEDNYYLDLGKVMTMAKVNINGKYVGGVWTAPWRIDVSQYLQVGSNTIEVSVINNWMNRLIGDSALPEEQRKTWLPYNPYNKDSALQSSGLLGPVSVYTIKY